MTKKFSWWNVGFFLPCTANHLLFHVVSKPMWDGGWFISIDWLQVSYIHRPQNDINYHAFVARRFKMGPICLLAVWTILIFLCWRENEQWRAARMPSSPNISSLHHLIPLDSSVVLHSLYPFHQNIRMLLILCTLWPKVPHGMPLSCAGMSVVWGT